MKKKDLIKHINESLEEFLPEGLEYNFPSINTKTGLVVDKNSTIGNLKIIRKEFEIKIDFVGMFGKGLGLGLGLERDLKERLYLKGFNRVLFLSRLICFWQSNQSRLTRPLRNSFY